jgi:hypothetical protein
VVCAARPVPFGENNALPAGLPAFGPHRARLGVPRTGCLAPAAVAAARGPLAVPEGRPARPRTAARGAPKRSGTGTAAAVAATPDERVGVRLAARQRRPPRRTGDRLGIPQSLAIATRADPPAMPAASRRPEATGSTRLRVTPVVATDSAVSSPRSRPPTSPRHPGRRWRRGVAFADPCQPRRSSGGGLRRSGRPDLSRRPAAPSGTRVGDGLRGSRPVSASP